MNQVQPHLPGTGIRGHSVNENIYPWLVVGVGSQWEVWDVDGVSHVRDPDIYYVHAEARLLKRLHPGGRIEKSPHNGEPYNISGSLKTVPERLAGLRITVTMYGDATSYEVAQVQNDSSRVKACRLDTVDLVNLSPVMLAEGPHVTLEVDLVPFYRGPSSRIEAYYADPTG